MLEKFKNHLDQNFPHLYGKKLLLTVSGGIDSVVLVHLCKKIQLEIGVAHCNFQLRDTESDEDELFVQELCTQYNIPIFIQKFSTSDYAVQRKLSTQLAARELRYNWFNEIIENNNYDYIVTAHHLDDQIETFLINLTRGTGLEGLTGIPEQNDKIIRPLLIFSRNEIENFANKNQIDWREDSSNASDKYLRNKIRHAVVPVLKQLNPSFLTSFQETLNHLKQSVELVEDVTAIMYERIVTQLDHKIQINIEELLKLKNYKSYLYQWLKEYGFTAWDDIYNLPYAQSGKQVFSNSYILLKDRNYLLLSPKEKEELKESFFINENLKNHKVPLNLSFCNISYISNSDNNIIFVDEDKLQFPLEIRKKKEGDSFYPSGMNGKKKLSKYFKDEKYSLLEKEEQWLLVSNNEIVWVIGKRADQRFLANENTQNTLKIELK
ncbi:tRNA lysidine(34) synthetase TilS [Flavobacterium sediminilitoris]|uniref:tRNA(Ile)-lysidine synthase n=1 Tax=Flavobacterium sediminilitoris TaxID=2024526 RepID=A0ABY4HL06_9FLAO|nr:MULTISPECIES: tRNA lysidine(34) synthetase TilS [Flavobacterium]UOX33539.1 tRNA lysidine(34) synthetase TilS [Flavobacterium sediminilitoris]